MSATLEEHLRAGGPKRVLALDGGGIRGILTLGYLKQIERLLKKRSGAGGEFRLCDYFDLIGGTSTGSIIAAGLALGFSVDRLLELYRDLGKQVFTRGRLSGVIPEQLQGVLAPKFPTGPVDDALQTQIGRDVTLGDPRLRTGLMIMTKRLDTGSPWPLHNNPGGKYYLQRPGGTGIPNRDFLLWQIVRASTAAPTYFEPELVEVASHADARRVTGAFVDGGVSPHGNPALQLFLLATVKGFHLEWQTDPEHLLLVSVGTGYESVRLDLEATMRIPPGLLGVRALASMMGDADALVRLLLQWMGRTLFSMPSDIDSEVGDLREDTVDGRKLLTYVRYNAPFEQKWLRDALHMDLSADEVAGLEPMDRAENIDRLATIGERAGELQVSEDHFPHVFDVRS